MKTNPTCLLASLQQIVLLLALLLLPLGSAAADDNPSRQPRHRPKIGLVLEGGGALGFAHVGLLKVLEENRIPVDLVAGTSIGSIVGAGYASGLTTEEMEQALSETKWDDLFGERVQRKDLTYRLKSGRARELYGDVKFGFKEGKFAAPSGLIVGQNVLTLFQKLFGNLPTPSHFDALPLPFRAVAADLETGEAYVPKEGNLAEVVRASMSVPGVFSPVEINGHILVDGGIVNNLPMDVARQMGADALIVSVLDDELPKRENLRSLLEVSGQVITLLLAQNSRLSQQTIRPEDVLVSVGLKGYTAGDFAKAQELMAIGEAAARNYVEALRRYAVSEEEYRRYQQGRTRKKAAPVHLDFVRVKNSSEVSDTRILRELRIKAGDTLEPDKIEEDVQRIFGTGYFTSVRYEVIQENGQTGLEIQADGKPWLHQYVRLGLSLEDDFEGDSSFRLGAVYRRYDLTTKGSYGEGQFEVGKFPRVALELYQPVMEDSAYFIAPTVSYGRTTLTVQDDGVEIARYNRTEGVGSFKIGREMGSFGEAGIGLTRGFGKLDRDIGDPTLPEFDYDIGEAYARIDIDTADTPDFPTQGFAGQLAYTSSLTDLGAEDSFDTLNAAATLPLTFGRDTFILAADFATTLTDRPVERSFGFGGFVDVSGFQQGSLTASDYEQGRMLYFHRFSEVQNPLFALGFFFGGSLELTSLRSDTPAIEDRTGILSGSIFVGADTPLLPTYLGYGRNDEQEDSFYLAIGRIGKMRR